MGCRDSFCQVNGFVDCGELFGIPNLSRVFKSNETKALAEVSPSSPVAGSSDEFPSIKVSSIRWLRLRTAKTLRCAALRHSQSQSKYSRKPPVPATYRPPCPGSLQHACTLVRQPSAWVSSKHPAHPICPTIFGQAKVEYLHFAIGRELDVSEKQRKHLLRGHDIGATRCDEEKTAMISVGATFGTWRRRSY